MTSIQLFTGRWVELVHATWNLVVPSTSCSAHMFKLHINPLMFFSFVATAAAEMTGFLKYIHRTGVSHQYNSLHILFAQPILVHLVFNRWIKKRKKKNTYRGRCVRHRIKIKFGRWSRTPNAVSPIKILQYHSNCMFIFGIFYITITLVRMQTVERPKQIRSARLSIDLQTRGKKNHWNYDCCHFGFFHFSF